MMQTVYVKSVDWNTYLVQIGDQSVIVPVDTSTLTPEALNILQVRLRTAIAELSYMKSLSEHEARRKKVELMNALREDKKMSKTEAESQVLLDESYSSLLKNLDAIQYQLDILWALLKGVETALRIKETISSP